MVILKKKLERLAIKAHTRGETWKQFCAAQGDAIQQVEPFDRQRYRRLENKLMVLVMSGNRKSIPTGDLTSWELDDAMSE